MNTALPIPRLSRVVSGEHPLKNGLHVALLFFVWFLPVTGFWLLLLGYGRSTIYLSDWLSIWPWLVCFTGIATVLSIAVGRSASVAWTLTVHGAGALLALTYFGVLR